MKVLQINAVSGIRSTGVSCVQLADYLNQNGHEGFIAYGSGLPYIKGHKIGNAFDAKAHALLSRITGKQAYFSVRATEKLLGYMIQIKPDVVHLRNLHSSYVNLKRLLRFLSQQDIPTVITLHDCWFYTGKCTHYTENRCFRWKNQCGNCPRLKRDNPSWFFDRTAQMLKDKKSWLTQIPRLAVVGVSDWIVSEARQSFLSSASIVARIYNGIDLEVFRPQPVDYLKKKHGLDGQFVILGVASRWCDSKGLNKFVMLAKTLPRDMRIILVGKMKRSVNLPANVIHVDETHDIKKMASHYAASDVLLNLSMEETFGKVSAEALACGTPVITIRSTANSELVGNGCGYVLAKYSLEAVRDAIMKIKENGKNKYSMACVSFAFKNFEMVGRMRDYVAVYTHLLRMGRK